MPRKPKLVVVDTTVVVAYLRVSTAEQAESGAGLAAQRTVIEAECARRGWTIKDWYIDAGMSGKSLTKREELKKALDDVRNRRAAGIVVAKLDRLSRSLIDFAALMATAYTEKWNIVAIDLNIDLSTPNGEMMAGIMAVLAQWERRIIGQRTRAALAEKRAEGVRLGRPRIIPDEVLVRIIAASSEGATYVDIATALNVDAVPTAQGGKLWYPSTIRAIVMSQDGRALETAS